ncbi:MAG: glycosyltransferase family 2 protein [Alloprevotella sp.]|nr:glycosyltransferase family 2 protein [Alloprevotella sp.]
MKPLTVFTPAYNRAATLPRTYESLVRQTCQDFEWLVVDDGSTDGTRELVDGWIAEGRIPIRYVWQENQGMHGAHNTAYRNINTELNICIDSDDFMPDDAVEKILRLWRERGGDRYCGIVGLDVDMQGRIIGTPLPAGREAITLRTFYEELGGRGDKKQAYRTDLVRQFPPYPQFEGEKYFGLGWLYYQLEEAHPLLVLNEPLVVVDYQDTGSSRSMWRQWWNNPQGFAYLRRYEMLATHSWKRRLVCHAHYVSHSLRSRDLSFLQKSPQRLLTLACLLPGASLFLLNYYKVKRNARYGG